MTQLTLAQRRAGAIANVLCDPSVGGCGRTPGSRCVSKTGSGKEVTPHTVRLHDFDLWISRQPEVDQLTQQVATLKAQNTDLSKRVTDAADDLAGAKSDLSALAAEKSQLATQLAKVTSDKAALEVLFTNLSTSDAALRAQVTQLQQQIAELTQPPAPEPARPLFGMNVSPGTSFTQGAKETAADQINRLKATYGCLASAKVFYSGALAPAFNITQEGLVPGRVVILCFKSFTVAALKSYLDSIPAGWLVLFVYYQEPDNEIFVDKTMAIADFRAKTKVVIDTVHAHPAYAAELALAASVFMEFSLTSGRWTDDLVVAGLDVLIFDVYWNTSAKDPDARVKAMADCATRNKVAKWGVGEKGDRRANTTSAVAASMQKATFTSGADRAAFWDKEYAAEIKYGSFISCYFNAVGTTGDHRLLPGETYSEPAIAVLKTYMSV